MVTYILEYFVPNQMVAHREEISAKDARQAKYKATRHLKQNGFTPISARWKQITDFYFHRVFDGHPYLKGISLSLSWEER